MLISKDAWVEIATADAIVQKISTGNLLLCYAAAPPTTEDFFILAHSDETRQDAVSGSVLYAKGEIVDVEITVNTV